MPVFFPPLIAAAALIYYKSKKEGTSILPTTAPQAAPPKILGGDSTYGGVRFTSSGIPEKDAIQGAIIRVLNSNDNGGWAKWREDRHGNTSNGKWFQNATDAAYQVYWTAVRQVLGKSTGYGDYLDYAYPGLDYVINPNWNAFAAYVNQAKDLWSQAKGYVETGTTLAAIL